jgi:formiminoglutamase
MADQNAYHSLLQEGIVTQSGARYRDAGIVRAGDIVRPLSAAQAEHVHYLLLGLPLSKSSISHSGASFTPDTVRQMLSSYTTYAIHADVDLQEVRLFDAGNVEMHVTDIEESHSRIRSAASAAFGSYHPDCMFLLGGDHSVTCPLIQGLYDALAAKGDAEKRVGMIQFDAHHDLRLRDKGGPSNGTPFRGLLESGTIRGSELVQIGIRDYANGKRYTDYAKEQGITVFTMDDVEQRGIIPLLTEALQLLQEQGIDWIYVSLDMDVMDQAFAPGCPAIGPGGMDTQTLFKALNFLARRPEVKAVDIVEIDPTLDVRDMTSRLAAQVLLRVMTTKEMQREHTNG